MSPDRKKPQPEDLLSSADVMELLDISRATLQRRVKDGTLVPVPQSGIKRGGTHLFTRASIEPYLPDQGDTS
jgi:predicted DNA-binding transcriptional regulator AlpA